MKTNELEIEKPDEELFQEGKREYIGMSGKTKIAIKPICSSLYLSRNYGKRNDGIKIGWKFNREGRIDLVDAMTFPDKDIHPILKIFHQSTVGGLKWNEAFVDYFPFPEQCKEINSGFISLSEEKKYSEILRFGHTTIAELFKNLHTKNVRDAETPRRNDQRALAYLLEDEAAMHILGCASNLVYSIRNFGKGSFEVYYFGR